MLLDWNWEMLNADSLILEVWEKIVDRHGGAYLVGSLTLAERAVLLEEAQRLIETLVDGALKELEKVEKE